MSINQLYNTLKKDTKDVAMSQKDKEELLENINLLDQKGKEMLYILIKTYDLEVNPPNDNPPFKSKLTSKELKFNLDDIPNKLKFILKKFVVMHIQNMNEESEIAEKRKNIIK